MKYSTTPLLDLLDLCFRNRASTEFIYILKEYFFIKGLNRYIARQFSRNYNLLIGFKEILALTYRSLTK